MNTTIVGRNILEKNTLRRVLVEVPEWKGSVYVRELTAFEVAKAREFAIKSVGADGKPDTVALGEFQIYLVCKGWVDEDGVRILDDSESESLQRQSGAVLEKLALEIATLSGLSGNASAAAKKN